MISFLTSLQSASEEIGRSHQVWMECLDRRYCIEGRMRLWTLIWTGLTSAFVLQMFNFFESVDLSLVFSSAPYFAFASVLVLAWAVWLFLVIVGLRFNLGVSRFAISPTGYLYTFGPGKRTIKWEEISDVKAEELVGAKSITIYREDGSVVQQGVRGCDQRWLVSMMKLLTTRAHRQLEQTAMEQFMDKH